MNASSAKSVVVVVLLLTSISLTSAAPTPGKVCLVVGSDTAVWNVAGGVDVAKYHNHFLPDLYILPQQNGYKAMDPAFRNQYVDSYGQPLKLTWWMLVGSVYALADNTDVPIPNQMPLYLMQKYHGDAIKQFGDEVSLHYHTFFWSDYDGDGIFYWNEARTFHETRADFDFTLAQSLVEGEVFPVSFRSGWHYMDNEWQSYLNLLLPFSMHNDSPNVRSDNVEPYDNVYDWSKATTAFVPYHPSTTNYQLAGDGIGWNVRSVKMPSVTQTMMNQMFAAAAGGTDQVACLWAHLPESDFLSNIGRIDSLAHVAAGKYPTVQFRYCTAVEAMQRWLGTTDQTPPQLEVSQNIQGEVVTLNISASEPIFQAQPFVAVKDICENYRVAPCQPAGSNAWTATMPVSRSNIAKMGVGVTDLAGNVTTRVIRYLPDDLFLDNLDPQYMELSGDWSTTTNKAWGVDARVASLGTNGFARAQWMLPISNSGPYRVFVQVPGVTNAAGNVFYNLYSGGSNVLSVFFPAALPAKQWIYLGAPFLDAAVAETLELTVNGTNQTNVFAMADVVKLSPLVPEQGIIRNIQVQPSTTTANVTWTSLASVPTLVDYGPDLNYGSTSALNSLLLTNHVMTLTGLAPNTVYYLQIDSLAGGSSCTAQASFTTANLATSLLFDLTNLWKFSTNNLNGVNWQAAGYNDSGWSNGLGVLWTDDVNPGAGNPAIQFLPLNTEMPLNPSTGHPFITYYFRTHFTYTNSLSGVLLTFSNHIDDGAAFYLNGVEINRAYLPVGASNATPASGYNCPNANCPYVFTVSGANLQPGDNVVAVEVHNYGATSPDVTFGATLSYGRTFTSLPTLQLLTSQDFVTLYWNGSGFTLQQASHLGPPPTGWTDVPGPVTSSPYIVTNSPPASQSRFYRIRGP